MIVWRVDLADGNKPRLLAYDVCPVIHLRVPPDANGTGYLRIDAD